MICWIYDELFYHPLWGHDLLYYVLYTTCVIPRLWDGGRCTAGSPGQHLSTGPDEWSWCSALPPWERAQGKMSFDGSKARYSLTGSVMRNLRAVSPSPPSSGLGGRLDKAWEMKRRGTAHQCLEQSCWIICSNTWPSEETPESEIDRYFNHEKWVRALLSIHPFLPPSLSQGNTGGQTTIHTKGQLGMSLSNGRKPECPTRTCKLYTDRPQEELGIKPGNFFLKEQFPRKFKKFLSKCVNWGFCTSMLQWQAAEERGHEDLELSPDFRTISHPLPNWPTGEQKVGYQLFPFLFLVCWF